MTRMSRRSRIATAILVASLGGAIAGPVGAQDETLVRVGITLPLSGSGLASSGPIRDAVELLLGTTQIPGVRLEPVVLDHAVNGVHDPARGAADMEALVADPAVLAVVGPFNSSVAERQIPISNAAGLLQCSPANTDPSLTQGDAGRALRAAAPDRINYVRVQATDDLQGPAMARYATGTLGLRDVAVVDDGEGYGSGIADTFAAELAALGGTVTGRWTAPVGSADLETIASEVAATGPDAVYFGGVTATGAPALRLALVAAGLGEKPFLVAEGVADGSADTPDSYLTLTGPDAAGTWTSQSAMHDYPGRADLDALLRDAGLGGVAAYSGSAAACAEVVIAAIAEAAARGSLDRETVRAAATAGNGVVLSVLGPIRFDAVGDTLLRVVSFYRPDLAIDADPATPGVGDWIFIEQVDLSEEG